MSCFGKKKKGDKKKLEGTIETYQPTALIKKNESNTVTLQEISKTTTTTTTLTSVEKLLNVNTNKSAYVTSRSISTSSNGSSNLLQAATATDAVPFSNVPFSAQQPLYKFPSTRSARSAFFSEPLTTSPNNSKVNLNYQSPYAYRWNALSSFDKTKSPRVTNGQSQQTSLQAVYDTEVLRQKINIKVVKNGKFYDNEPNQKVPVYSTRSKYRGKLLLINNIKFINEKLTRTGAEFDEFNVKQLFYQMGFTITDYRNLTRKAMEDKIMDFRKDNTLKRVDIGAVIIMSHGTGGERSDSTEVACVDGQRLDTHWIINQFDNEQCPNLQGKPKIFIFQCCRGDRVDIVHDAIPFTPSRVSCDMLIAYSTVPGFVSHRDPKSGTWYIQAICRIFMEHAYDTDVENLLKMVDHALSQLSSEFGSRQTSSFENRGFKTCFLHP